MSRFLTKIINDPPGGARAPEDKPRPVVTEAPRLVESLPIASKIAENRTARQPELDSQTARLDSQPTGQPDSQTASVDNENRYPSRRNRTQITARLPAQKVEKYKLWCFMNRVDLQDAIERGMDWLTGQLDSQSSTYQFDDIDDTSIDEGIINFYERWTRNKATVKDKAAHAEVQHLAPHIIKCGILLSLQRAKGRINSFRYCHGAINEMAESGSGEDYLKYMIDKIKTGKA